MQSERPLKETAVLIIDNEFDYLETYYTGDSFSLHRAHALFGKITFAAELRIIDYHKWSSYFDRIRRLHKGGV